MIMTRRGGAVKGTAGDENVKFDSVSPVPPRTEAGAVRPERHAEILTEAYAAAKTVAQARLRAGNICPPLFSRGFMKAAGKAAIRSLSTWGAGMVGRHRRQVRDGRNKGMAGIPWRTVGISGFAGPRRPRTSGRCWPGDLPGAPSARWCGRCSANFRRISFAGKWRIKLLWPGCAGGPVLAPVLRARMVCVPRGSRWRHACTGGWFDGVRHVTVSAPLNAIPAFLREGARGW